MDSGPIDVAPSTLALPYHANMTEDQVIYVCEQLDSMKDEFAVG